MRFEPYCDKCGLSEHVDYFGTWVETSSGVRQLTWEEDRENRVRFWAKWLEDREAHRETCTGTQK